MQLPSKLRDILVNELDEYFDAVGSEPDPEAVSQYVIELLETFADDAGMDELVEQMEEEAALDTNLQQTLEEEMSSNDEFKATGEELATLVERLCMVEWGDEEDDDGGDDDTDF